MRGWHPTGQREGCPAGRFVREYVQRMMGGTFFSFFVFLHFLCLHIRGYAYKLSDLYQRICESCKLLSCRAGQEQGEVFVFLDMRTEQGKRFRFDSLLNKVDWVSLL